MTLSEAFMTVGYDRRLLKHVAESERIDESSMMSALMNSFQTEIHWYLAQNVANNLQLFIFTVHCLDSPLFEWARRCCIL